MSCKETIKRLQAENDALKDEIHLAGVHALTRALVLLQTRSEPAEDIVRKEIRRLEHELDEEIEA